MSVHTKNYTEWVLRLLQWLTSLWWSGFTMPTVYHSHFEFWKIHIFIEQFVFDLYPRCHRLKNFFSICMLYRDFGILEQFIVVTSFSLLPLILHRHHLEEKMNVIPSILWSWILYGFFPCFAISKQLTVIRHIFPLSKFVVLWTRI